jgi:hypothetical protein
VKFADTATPDDFRKLLFAGHAYVRHEFYRALSEKIDAAVIAMTAAHTSFRAFESAALPLNERSAHVQAFLWTSFNSAASSLFLLLSGFVPASGNLMRHFGEALSMALLCSDPRINTFIKVKQNPESFSYHDALRLVNKKENRKKLDIDEKAWEQLMKLTKFYDNFSHATMLTVAANAMLEAKGQIILLGEYDPAKASTYDWELTARTSAFRVLQHLSDVLKSRLPFDKNEPSTAA